MGEVWMGWGVVGHAGPLTRKFGGKGEGGGHGGERGSERTGGRAARTSRTSGGAFNASEWRGRLAELPASSVSSLQGGSFLFHTDHKRTPLRMAPEQRLWWALGVGMWVLWGCVGHEQERAQGTSEEGASV